MENLMFFSKLICFIVGIIMIVAGWKIFEKAKKPGWAVLIPIYNLIILLQIINKPWWWLLLFFIPAVNIIYIIWATNLLSKKFGYDVGFTVGLLLLPFIFYLVLGFGDSTYKGATAA